MLQPVECQKSSIKIRQLDKSQMLLPVNCHVSNIKHDGKISVKCCSQSIVMCQVSKLIQQLVKSQMLQPVIFKCLLSNTTAR